MANGHDAIEGWEWDSVFLLPDPSLLEQDTSIGAWQDHFSDSTTAQARILTLEGGADLSCASGLRNGSVQFTSGASTVSEQEPLVRISSDGSPVSSDEYDRRIGVSDHNNPLESSLGNSSDVSEEKKKDPRLDCPNFLAGRIPCSCPEMDEIEDGETEDTGKKRQKAAARCQVPSCGGDIGHLKGYHQRHRVCLGCANSPKVILKDQPHRYCQQCGKFHRLSDFDEGKRSCRRKLERHNKRRRRRPLEAGGEREERAASVLASAKDHHDAGSSSVDAAPSRGETRPSSPVVVRQKVSAHDLFRNPRMESEQLCHANAPPREQVIFQFKETVLGDLSSAEAAQCLVINGQAHAPAEREGQNIPSANLQMYESSSCQQPVETPVGQSREDNVQVLIGCAQNGGGLAGGFTKVLGNTASAEEHHASDASSASALRLGHEMLRSNKSRLDEQSWLAMLMDDTMEGVGLPLSLKSASQTTPSKPELQKSSLLSTGHKRCSGYISPCPMGRVSFKLYDWNPADFPRRLRQQIFEWLANMPVELEGYIRSGCILLTFFITMSQSDWDKIINDWIGHVQNIVLGPGHELQGTGHIIACLNDKNVCVKNGKILRLYSKEDLAPTVVDLYPLALEAGCATEIYISGFNLDTTKSRFFVSFGEQCLECNSCEPVEDCHNTQKTVGLNDHSLEIRKITVLLPDCKKFGPAYVEVDNDHGISNAMPLLVADKGVCAEVNSLGLSPELPTFSHEYQAGVLKTCKEDLLGQQCCADLLTDLGWVFRCMEESSSIRRAEVRTTIMKRLERLLFFSARHGWYRVAKRLLYTAMDTGLIAELGIGSDEQRRQHVLNLITMKAFKSLMNIHMPGKVSLLECLLNEIKIEQSNPSPSEVTLCSADGSYGSKSQHHYKELQGAECRSAVNEVEQLYLPFWDSELNSSGNLMSAQVYKQSFMEVPLLEKRVPIMEDTLQKKKSPFGWLKKSARNLGSMHIYSTDRKLRQIVITAASLVMLCVGMCVVLQHPHQVTEISMSLRRCLWGSSDRTVPLV